MIYPVNIFICLAAPLVIALFLIKGRTRRFIAFFICGLLACLLAGYVNAFIAGAAAKNGYVSMTTAQSMVRLTPVCEEVLKALPVFLYAAVFRPKRSGIVTVALAVGLGFATMENTSQLMNYGASQILFVLTRGFASGSMHAICAAILGYGLAFVYKRERMAFTGSFAALCAAATFHGVYNMLVSAGGFWLATGYALPNIMAGGIMLCIMNAELRIKNKN